MIAVRVTVVRSSATNMKRNSAAKTAPISRPAGTVPGAIRTRCPRTRIQAQRQSVAPAERTPAKNTGCKPSLTTLMTT